MEVHDQDSKVSYGLRTFPFCHDKKNECNRAIYRYSAYFLDSIHAKETQCNKANVPEVCLMLSNEKGHCALDVGCPCPSLNYGCSEVTRTW